MRGRVSIVAIAFALLVGCGDDEASSSTGGGGGASGSSATTGATGTGTGPGSGGGATTGAGATTSGATSGSGAGTTTGSGGGGGGGIAAQFPGDEGIEGHPDVIFADDFESYGQPGELAGRWDAVYQLDRIRLATEPENVFGGRQALEFSVPQQEAELSNALDKVLAEERDELHLRYCSKFDTPFDVVGSSHNGSMISAHYFIDGQATPGVPADGTNKFLVNLENWRGEPDTPSPGHLNLYVYHPEQRSQWGDHFFPTGVVLPNSSQPGDFGEDFVPRPDVLTELDRWFCYEYMVRANTPGQRDGRVTVWVDGVVVADFGNLRLRDVADLRIDRFGLSFHIGSNPAGETRKWYDHVVAATSYIGPVASP